MAEEHPKTLEDRIAERLARFGLLASIVSLLVLGAVASGNILILALKIVVNAVLAIVVNQGPATAAILGGISTAISYYGRMRVLRRREAFSIREEVADQVMDQAGNVLGKVPNAARSLLGCSSSLSMGVLGTALIVCALTYFPPPLQVLGAHSTAVISPVSAATATIVPTATLSVPSTATAFPTAQPTATATSTSTPAFAPTATPRPAPTPTPKPPPPGNLLVLTPTVDLGSTVGGFCGDTFGSQSSSPVFFSFTNNGGTTIYWQVVLPSYYQLVINYPNSGSMPPKIESQRDYFYGSEAEAPPNTQIEIDWGLSPNSFPQKAFVATTCNNPPG